MADPVTMAVLTIASGAVAAGGSLLSGAASAQAHTAQATSQAQMLRQKAADEQAAAAVKARNVRKKGEYAQSRVRAVAASAAGNATDPTVLNVLTDIGVESEYRQKLAQYGGDQTASNLRTQAVNTWNMGAANASAAKTASYFDAASSILGSAGKAGSSLYAAKYAPGGAPVSSPQTIDDYLYSDYAGGFA